MQRVIVLSGVREERELAVLVSVVTATNILQLDCGFISKLYSKPHTRACVDFL